MNADLAPSVEAVGDPADELAEQTIVNDAVKAAIGRHDMVGLSRMAERLRRDRTRTASGAWELPIFYARVEAELGPSAGACADRSAAFFRDWMAKTPAAAAPYIARAAILEDQAWCIRGSGYVSTVGEAASAGFAAKVDAADAILRLHRQASVDPQYYAVMEQIYIDRGASKAQLRQLLDQATAREPNYHHLYYEAYRYYQPQWFGSAAEIEQMARYAASRTTGDDQPGMYARYYWHVINCGCGGIAQSIDWPTMKQSMRAVMVRYPTAWNAATFARIACTMDDAAETKLWFARVTGDVSLAFRDQRELQRCRALAPLDRSIARCPYAAREGWTREDVDRYCRG